MERRKYLISDLELTDVSLSDKRYFETTEFLIYNFEQRVELDIQTLPECTRLDSLERYLDIYETAYLNFTINSENHLGERFREHLQDLVGIYGETVIYPTKRKVEYIKGLISKEAVLPHQQKAKLEFTNNFDNVEAEDVREHFKKGLVNRNMLNDNELADFLFTAFEKQIVPQKKFIFKKLETKQKVMKVFYQYYTDKAGKPHGKQKKYAALLGDYFEGFNSKNVSSNFSKTTY